MPGNEWNAQEYATSYLAAADDFPHRAEGEGVLLELVPEQIGRVLDLGTGSGRLLSLLGQTRTGWTGVGLDVSPPMLEIANEQFSDDPDIQIIEHDLVDTLPELGNFDLVVSSFAIHHLEHERKRSLYAEVFGLLEPGGVFINFEHVASTSQRRRLEFIHAIGETLEDADPSDRLLDVESQLEFLRKIGFEDVDCYWKWREMALLSGVRS